MLPMFAICQNIFFLVLNQSVFFASSCQLGSISQTFYLQLLRVQIPKAQKVQSSRQSFCAFGICASKKNVDEIDPRMRTNAIPDVVLEGFFNSLEKVSDDNFLIELPTSILSFLSPPQ